ncbi:TonB-dependent receptor [Ralstonia sp. A12]|uniref:TonB-dependent siderophore receptor n=1 Tax=Ralstonia sp. A12 TaxID=1217052 RepID=UPI0005736E8B|nr:TonB-dependent siderophore receptor [Ralstonia sp. A12]KHK56209.1 TonB-dependent receptor [Ralstonia sp. A12]
MTRRLTARALPCALAAIPLAALLTATLARADDTPPTGNHAKVDLDETTVTARSQRGFAASIAEVGAFRGMALRDIPATVNVVTREALDAQQDTSLFDALRNTASVTRQQLSGETFDNLAIRGVTMENRTNFRFNGSMPIAALTAIPLEDKERVEVLKGVSALYYGYTTPGGVVNLVTKRAGNTPVTTLGVQFDSNGSIVSTLDVGRRFGEDNQYGIRFNAAGGSLQSPTNGIDGTRQLGAVAFDWKVNSRLSLKADVEYSRKVITEQSVVTLPAAKNGVITLPAMPDPTKRIAPGWADFDGNNTNALLRADYALTDAWLLTVEGGMSETARSRAFSEFRLTNPVTGAGTISGNRQNGRWNTSHVRADISGTEKTGWITHDLTFGVARSDMRQAAVYSDRFSGAQNLYNPVDLGWLPTVGNSFTAEQRAVDTGVYAMDRMTLSEHWQVIAGLRYTRYTSEQAPNRYEASKTTPLGAVIYKFTPTLSAYASYAQGLEAGARAPNTAANANVAMPPALSEQKEVGVRYETPAGTQLAAAVYDIDRAASYTNDANLFVQDGRERIRGVELTAQGRVTKDLSLLASAGWTDAKFRGVGNGLNGKTPENTPRSTASVFAEYTLPMLRSVSFNAGAYYLGPRPVNDANQAELGGTTLFSAGVRYVTRISGKRTTLQFNVDNLTDKRYWAGAGNNRLSMGAPRLFKLGMKIDL